MSSLIDYSSSESDSDSQPKTSQDASSTPALPPLPSGFHNLYATTVRTSTVDDPSLHSGRVRQIPHADGIWPSHVQLEWHPSSAHQSLLTNFLSNIPTTSEKPIHSLLTSQLGAPTPLHISLSRTLPVLTNQRSSFLEQLRAKIRETRVQHFTVRLNRGLTWESNEDGTRFFLVIKPNGGATEMRSLLRTCNQVVKDCGLGEKGLYDDSEDRFHFSIAWRLGRSQSPDKEKARLKRKRTVTDEDLQKAWESSAGKAVGDIEVPFDKVMVRIGNAVHAIELAEQKTKINEKGS